ncbi:MAG: ferrous iron transport protein A [Planctomycetaceae bacterium]|nr:ferrous iron transport protein A [Planctomycetaceae bacterium]
MIKAAEVQTNSNFALKSPRIFSLDLLCRAKTATIVALNTSNDLQGRLMGMGLTAGAKIEVLQGAQSLFKPLLVAVGETRIAVGRDIARVILVEAD